jgi:Raf kinase inhibitor-like YbhB/YbcL family protein
MPMQVKSPAFENGGTIPARFTCDGSDISPPLEISDLPAATATLTLVMDDPDAPGGTFDHWLVWNIPPSTARVAEGVEPDGVAGRTDFGRLGYGGPCPPGGTHRYVFTVYALDMILDLPEGASKSDLEVAMGGHILARAQLTGRYARTGG